MKAYTNIATNIAKVTLISIILINLTSCGSYQYANRDDDSVYASSKPKERIVYVERPSKNQSNYFLDQAKQFEDLNGDDVLVDIDSLSNNKNDTIGYVSGTPWEYTKDVTVNVYASPYNYYGYGGYYNNFYYDYPYYGYGYNYGYYNPYYGYPYYGYYDYYNPYYSNYYYGSSFYIGFGYGYPYYNPYYYSPYYNGYYNGYSRSANYHKRNTFNTRGRRSSFTSRYNRNFKSNTNRYSVNRNNFSKRNSANTYKRNNNSKTYNRNNYNKNNSRSRTNTYKRSGYQRSNYSRSHNQSNYRPNINRSRGSSGSVGKKPVYRRNHIGVNDLKKRNSNAVVAAKDQRKTYGRVYYRNNFNRYNAPKKGRSANGFNTGQNNVSYKRSATNNVRRSFPTYKSYNNRSYSRNNNTNKRNYSNRNSYKPRRANTRNSSSRNTSSSRSHSNNTSKIHKSYRRNN